MRRKVCGHQMTFANSSEVMDCEKVASLIEEMAKFTTERFIERVVDSHNMQFCVCSTCDTAYLRGETGGKLGSVIHWNSRSGRGRRSEVQDSFRPKWPSGLYHCLPCALSYTEGVVAEFCQLTKKNQLSFLRCLSRSAQTARRSSNTWPTSIGGKFYIKLAESLMPHVNTRGHRAVTYLTNIMAACNLV